MCCCSPFLGTKASSASEVTVMHSHCGIRVVRFAHLRSAYKHVAEVRGLPSQDGQGSAVGALAIPGRMFPVRDLYLEDALELTGFAVGRSSRRVLAAPGSRWHRPVDVVCCASDDGQPVHCRHASSRAPILPAPACMRLHVDACLA